MFRLLQVDSCSIMILNSPHIRERTEGNDANDSQELGEHSEAGGWWQRGHHYSLPWPRDQQMEAGSTTKLLADFVQKDQWRGHMNSANTVKAELRPKNWSWCWLIFCFWVRLKILKFSNISHLPHLTGYRKGNWWDDQVGGQEWGR